LNIIHKILFLGRAGNIVASLSADVTLNNVRQYKAVTHRVDRPK